MKTYGLAELREELAKDELTFTKFEDRYEEVYRLAAAGRAVDDLVRYLWDTACEDIAASEALFIHGRELSHSEFRREFFAGVERRLARLTTLMRRMAVEWEGLDLTTPNDIYAAVWTIRITPLAYLRAMWNLFWSAIRHPLSETTIDLSTGRVLYRT